MKFQITTDATTTLADRLTQLIEQQVPLTAATHSSNNDGNLIKFAHHLISISDSSVSVLLTAVTYLERYFSSNQQLETSKPLPHALLLVSLMTSFKYVNEKAVTNRAWANITDGLFSLREVNQLECNFLAIIKYTLFVEDDATQHAWNQWLDDAYIPATSPTSSVGGSEQDSTSPADSAVSSFKDASAKGGCDARWRKWKGFWNIGRRCSD
ncbi:hypothetical protein BJ741DRAFT_639499 [Chytriomyces cf. hyalinus JEL632]|nr:hypothetical protein BJ741DRAFT_639499 [Chytriomyces cf. hyalinus JEL632]